MTSDELNEVRDLRTALIDAEKVLEVWRRAEALKIPTRDGLPKSHSVDSRVERIAVKVIDAERKVAELKAQLADAIPRLEQKICAKVEDSAERALLLFRYVEGMYFCDIGFLMGYSEAHVYYLHRIAREKLIGDSSSVELHNS